MYVEAFSILCSAVWINYYPPSKMNKHWNRALWGMSKKYVYIYIYISFLARFSEYQNGLTTQRKKKMELSKADAFSAHVLSRTRTATRRLILFRVTRQVRRKVLVLNASLDATWAFWNESCWPRRDHERAARLSARTTFLQRQCSAVRPAIPIATTTAASLAFTSTLLSYHALYLIKDS